MHATNFNEPTERDAQNVINENYRTNLVLRGPYVLYQN